MLYIISTTHNNSSNLPKNLEYFYHLKLNK